MMASEGRHVTLLQPQAQDIMSFPSPLSPGQMVVFLPDNPVWLLSTLQHAAFLLKQTDTPLPMLILSHCPAGWLWHTLLHLVADRSLLNKVRAASSSLPVRYLAALLHSQVPEDYPPLEQLSGLETVIHCKSPGGLSKPELNVILDLLHGYSIIDQVKHRGISQKTLYNQRTSGLKKMAEHYPHLAASFPGYPVNRHTGTGSDVLSAFECEFVHAIHCRHVFPVFQPITGSRQQLPGVAIIFHWRRDGNILLPGEFLSQVHSEYALLALSAFMLREAVQYISQYPGEFCFSVNIPSAIAGHRNLLRMIKTTRQQLHQFSQSDRLVLGFGA
ncbi:EAL domain-containing protein [Salmonella enterica]|nr:EAL domain-containing protein [Salmonella enterica subsp. diarizonae serovar 42:l,v:1,5,7]